MTDYEIALITGGMGIAGVLLGVRSTYHLSMKVADRQFSHLQEIAKIDAWHIAAHQFIEAFAGDIVTIEARTEPPGDIMDFLRSEYPRHAKAVAVFEHFVSDAKRINLKAEWEKHCYGEKGVDWPTDEDVSGLGHDELLFLHYCSSATEPYRSTTRLRAVRRMLTLIDCAKET